MIFKHFFRSKHQNPDPQVRLQAIKNLDKQDPQHKTLLHELAFNDGDTNVNLAALQRLDSFALWYKMSQIGKNERVQKKSLQFVESALLDAKNQVLSEQQKREFISETGDKPLIEKLLSQAWIQQDTELTMSLLQKADKPQLQEKLLLDTQNESLQVAIIATLTDSAPARKLLNKILKKTSSSTLKSLADKTLQAWLVAQQAPIEVEQQVTMVLSRMLALKDRSDFPHMQQQQIALNAEYAQITERFLCLTEQKRAEIEQKYTDISARIETLIKSLKPQWQAQQAERALSLSIQTLVADIKQSLAQQATQLTTQLSDITPAEVQHFAQELTQHLEKLHSLTKQLPATEHTAHKTLEHANNQLQTRLHSLEHIPELQQAIQLGQGLVENFSSLALPNDASQVEAAEEYFKEQQQEWRNITASHQAHIPTSLTKQWEQQVKVWRQAIKSLRSQINSEVSRCRNKIKAVESLISQGKYKAALQLYQKVQNWFNALPEKQQGQLERHFNTAKEKIENLKDWQDYIAAPRKPALLAEAEALVAQPLEINAQSSAIKSLRSQWNSMGKTDTESDQALNEAFETAIEKAFAPCREYYDQQQQQREQNMLAKQQLLSEIKALDEPDCGGAELAKRLRAIQQKWKNIGEVDYKQRHALFESYQQLLNPLRDKVSAFYTDNAEQKQALLGKAEKLLELDGIDEAIEQAKKLQQTWKTIEHAGKKAEAKLWPAFRKVNDTLFAKKAATHQQQQAQLKQQVTAVKEQVLQLESLIANASDKTSVQNALQDKQKVMDDISSLPMTERRTLENRVQKTVELQQVKLTELEKSAQGQVYIDLFDALKTWQTNGDMPQAITQLSKPWQQCFREPMDNVDRHALTIKMEITAQQDSPKKDAEKRKTIQMQLMAQKLQSGDSLDLQALLKDWIKGGPITKADLTLLKRVAPLFLG
ncbi:DUF349 domain-containing protein [uncultured Paraglaciecola sp.]|uniref:DUF349 domain-containing protein n=1 Tax=uncultured Paraglaciecola sp. TaxID=1765024 RepID=UPI0026273A86|nr:DUF349 domain-containing protein [uncultured Paraglaciecola sp.]